MSTQPCWTSTQACVKFPLMTEEELSLGERIRQRRERLGWSQAKLAEEASTPENPINQQTIGRVETGETKFSRAVPAVVATLEKAEGLESDEWQDTFKNPKLILSRDALIKTGRLPIYAAAEGGQGSEVLTTDPINFVSMPEPLQDVKDAFGVYIIGESMVPAFEPGDIVLIHPHRSPRGDDDVLISRSYGGAAQVLVKRLIRATPSAWKVRQFNPPKEFELKRQDWPMCRLIVGKYSRR